MKEPRTPIPWTPRTILHLAVVEDIDFAVLAANQHAKLLKALLEIARREGAFNRDPRLHAENTIDNMERIARAAIEEAERESEKRLPA